MDRTNRFMALGSPAPENTNAGAKTVLAKSTRLEASAHKSIGERLGGVNMSDMLDAMGDVIQHIDSCIEDQMKRPNFEPTDRFLYQIRRVHVYLNRLAVRVRGFDCTRLHRDYIMPNLVKEGETQTDPEIPPKLSYAAVISQNIPPSTLPKGNKSDPPPVPPPESRTKSTASRSKKAKGRKSTSPPKQETSKKLSPTPSLKPIPKERTLPQSGRAIVVHGIAVTKKLGKVRDWMENANPWMGKIVAARWLVKKERREGKKASSIVIYLEGEVESDSQTPAKVRLSGKWYDSCLYDWDRNSKVDRKGKGREVEEMDLTA